MVLKMFGNFRKSGYARIPVLVFELVFELSTSIKMIYIIILKIAATLHFLKNNS